MIKIECTCCRECFEPKEIKYSTSRIPENLNREEMIVYAEESGIRFDCPKCEEVQYLSDCEIF